MIRNMDFNLAAVLMLAFVFTYFYTQYDTKTKSSKSFMRLLIYILVTALLNIVCDMLLVFFNANIFIYILYSVYLYFSLGCAFTLTEYTRVVVNPEGKLSIYDAINYAIMVVHIIICVLSVKTHVYVNLESGTVLRSSFYILVYLFSGYYLSFTFFRMIRNKSVLSKRQTHGIIAFVCVTFTGALLQFFVFGDEMLIYFIYAISCLILLFSFETPDYQRMIKATEELKLSKEQLEDEKVKADNLYKTVNQLMKTSSWVIDFDEEGNFKEARWSDEIKNLLGYSLEDDVEASTLWQNSLHPEDKEAAINAFTLGLRGEEYRIEARLRLKDGAYKWFLCTGSLDLDENGNVKSYQGVIQNIEDEIYKRELINEKLKAVTELEKSQAELKQALLNAEEASRAKTIFLSNMSHDIRTPMNAIVGYTQLAKEHIEDKVEVLDCLNTIKSSGEHLLSLINDVLDMSRIESGKVKVENVPCNLSEMIHEIELLTKANVEERHQTYETIIENLDSPYVMCDRLRLNQILINCVGNAVKYTQEGGDIKVSLCQNNTDKENVKEYVFKVKDNGIGMSEEFLKHVFEPFERAQSSTTSSIQGTGLGMAITQNLINMMGGTISAESELGKGSTFIVKLPLTLISMEEYEASKETSKSDISVDDMLKELSGKHFLVIDDNKINRTIVKRLLGERGLIIDECDSGVRAIEIMSSPTADEYDMIFMDIQMPIMNGYEATDAIRNLDSKKAKEIPIIAMTADAFEDDKKRAREHGMNGHVTKPFKVDELVPVLYSFLC